MRVIFFCAIALTFFIALSQTSESSKTETLQALLESSQAAYQGGDYPKSFEAGADLIARAAKIKDTVFLQKGYRNIAYNYLVLEDTTQARINFEMSHIYASDDDKLLGQNCLDFGDLYMNMGDSFYKKSIDYFQKSIDYFEKTKDSLDLAKAYLNISLSLNKTQKYEALFPYLKKLTLLAPSGPPHFVNVTQNMWGEYHMSRKEYYNAQVHYSKVIAGKLGKADPQELETSYKGYSQALYQLGLYKKAYEAQLEFQKYANINDEVLVTKQSQKLAASLLLKEYKKNLEKNELSNQLQTALVKSQNYWNRFLSIITISSILLIVFLFRHYRTRQLYIQKLKAKNQEYLHAKNESEELAKAKTTFFSTVSHELRTPLYGVIGLSSALMDDPKLKSHEEDLKSLKFSADYLLALINDVLQINKIDSKTLDEHLEEIDIREFITNISSSFEFMCIENSNKIHITIDSKLPEIITANTTRLSQILINLIGNACKFTQAGDIYINLEEKKRLDDQVCILFTIKDNGIGIPPENHLSIFNEFSQVGSNGYTYQGTGLGLPIVKKLLDLSNTKIHLTSKLNEGTTFSFILSFTFTDQVTPTQRSIIWANPDALKGKKILIVDDNYINQLVTKKILKKFEVLCTIANNGQEAIDIVRISSFDLILMDINMPVKDGLTATQEIRGFNEFVPIVALTAVEVREMRCKIYEAGLTDIIVKPYDIEQFKQTILRNILKKIPLEVRGK